MRQFGGLMALLVAAMGSLAYGETAHFNSNQRTSHPRHSHTSNLNLNHDDQILKSHYWNKQNAQKAPRHHETPSHIQMNEVYRPTRDLPAENLIYEDKFDQQTSVTRDPKATLDEKESARSSQNLSQQRSASEEHNVTSSVSPRTHLLANSVSSPLISSTTMSSIANESAATYATINYNGLIGVNASDPFSITTESRSVFTLPTEVQILMCLFYGTLAFTAIASNMIVCYIVLSNQRMRTATNYFIVNLAVGDILMALLCIPFTFPANLIFQYWPFGLSLCVIVSYSQANSVFISAYTMVAISIDKYIAIMHPMRLRMPKNQAKIIILAIWSAALLTSLPTALLSSLTPADTAPPQQTSTTPALTMASLALSTTLKTSSDTTGGLGIVSRNEFAELGSASSEMMSSESNLSARSHEDRREQAQTQTTPMMNNEQHQGKLLASLSDSSSGTLSPSKMSSLTQATTAPQTSSSASLPLFTASTMSSSTTTSREQKEYEESMKYFCQESWNFWPPGKKYYSMALMILQFALPLFVLVITYTRIVIVVWGKRMPGEEDNARDARMARSKRKMIKMVIFCVIAFALTWLPFNALILIGDVHPVIWEHNHIMYIWFITHYLAMCHTITNPLIYIWMNNRFRAGFKQVIGDMCRFLQRSLAFLLCYCLCLGCCFNCTRQKYARVALDINRKRDARGTLASSGSANPNNHHNATFNNNNNTTTNTNNNTNYSNYNQTNNMTTMSAYLSNHQSASSAAASGRSEISRSAKSKWTAPDSGRGSQPVGVELSTSGHSRNFAADSQHDHHEPDLNSAGQQRAQPKIDPRMASNEAQAELPISDEPKSGGVTLDAAATGEPLREQCHAARARHSSPQLARNLRQMRLFRRSRNSDEQLRNRFASPCAAQMFANTNNIEPLQVNTSSSSGARQAASQAPALVKRRHKRKRTHAISLQMTTCEFYAPNLSSMRAKHKESCKLATSAPSNESGKWRLKRFRAGTRPTKLAAAATAATAAADCPSCFQSWPASTGAGPKRNSRAGPAEVNADSKFYVVDLRQSSQSTATISAQTNNTSLAISPLNSNRESRNESGDNNTSNSLSAIGNVNSDPLDLAPGRPLERLEGQSADQSNNRPLVKQGRRATLLTSGPAGEEREQSASLIAKGNQTRNEPAHNDSFDESSPSRVCVSLRLEHERAHELEQTKGSAGNSGGTLSGATSLEGHQLASSRSTPSHECELERASSGLLLNGRARPPHFGPNFCAQHHRQASSVSDQRHLSALSSDEQDYLETENEEEEQEQEREQEREGQETLEPGQKLEWPAAVGTLDAGHQALDVTGRRHCQAHNAKSSSTFELVSDHLLLGRRRRAYFNQNARPSGRDAGLIMERRAGSPCARQAARLGPASSNRSGADESSSGDSELDEEANLVAEYGDSTRNSLEMGPISSQRRIKNGRVKVASRGHLLELANRLHSSQPESQWRRPAAGATVSQIGADTSETRALLLEHRPRLKMGPASGRADQGALLVDLSLDRARRSIANYH